MASEMTYSGWIKLWRKLASDSLWLEERFTKGQAWVDLLLLAQGLDKTEYYDGQYAEYKAGTVYRSMSWLAKRWKWNRRTVANFLDNLALANMVDLVTNKRIGTIIRIKNWVDYQSGKNSDQIVVTRVLAETPEKVHKGFARKPSKSAQPKFEAQQGFEADFRNPSAQTTAQMSAQITAQMTAHKKEDKEEEEDKELFYVHSQTSPPPPPAPLLIGGGGDGSSGKTRDDIPIQWRDDFETYEAYWRWRNQ